MNQFQSQDSDTSNFSNITNFITGHTNPDETSIKEHFDFSQVNYQNITVNDFNEIYK